MTAKLKNRMAVLCPPEFAGQTEAHSDDALAKLAGVGSWKRETLFTSVTSRLRL